MADPTTPTSTIQTAPLPPVWLAITAPLPPMKAKALAKAPIRVVISDDFRWRLARAPSQVR